MGLYGDRVLPHLLNVVMNNKQTRSIRTRVCAGLSGEVVEIGFGTGHNLPFLPDAVKRVYAVEPSGVGVQLAAKRIGATGVDVEVVGLDGQRLPLADESMDAALCTWSLCTIPDPVAAVREVRRVQPQPRDRRDRHRGRAADRAGGQLLRQGRAEAVRLDDRRSCRQGVGPVNE